MKCNEVRRTLGWAAFLSLFTLATTYAGQNGGQDPNEPPVMTLAEETRKVAYLGEAVRWPAPAGVKRYAAQPPAEEKSAFVKAIRKIIDPNMLPERLDERLLYLNAWRAEGRRTYLLDYNQGPYRIRLKNQQVHVQAGEKGYTSYWITVIIQRTDKDTCIQNINLAGVFRFTDQFLSKQLSSTAQDYSNVSNMTEPVFQQQGSGYFAAYPLNASNPPMDAVCIYTDGRTIVVNLKERRKVVNGQQRTDPVP
jgi:hypothetical protein